jgi:hypothetical protein
MESLFDKNFKKQGDPFNPMADDDSGDEEDKIIIKERMESDYTKRYINYDQQRGDDDEIHKSSDNNINR